MDLESAPEYAREAIREMISNGEIPSGTRIDQRELAKKLSLTTVPVREALCWLEAEGLVKRIPGRGVFCKTYTVDDIQELLEVRGVLESLAAGRAAERIGPRQKEELLACARKMMEEDAENGIGHPFLEKHVAFHRMIVELSCSQALINIWSFTHITNQVLVRLAAHIWPAQPHDHMALAEAIVSGDRERAEKAMRDHIAPTYQARLRALREEYGDAPIL